jgi:hypothetical protein
VRPARFSTGGENHYAFTGNAPNVTISYLTVRNFGVRGGNSNQGVANHDSASGWTIDHSTLTRNAGAGTMLGSRNTLSYDCLKNNEQYGFNAFLGGPGAPGPRSQRDRRQQHLQLGETVEGCGGLVAGILECQRRSSRTTGCTETTASGCGQTRTTGPEIAGNYIEGNESTGLIYEISFNALVEHNTFARNGLVDGPTTPGFPTSAIYVSSRIGQPRAREVRRHVLDHEKHVHQQLGWRRPAGERRQVLRFPPPALATAPGQLTKDNGELVQRVQYRPVGVL